MESRSYKFSYLFPKAKLTATLHFYLQSDIDRSQNSSNRATVKAPVGGNTQLPLSSKVAASSYRRPGRSRSHIDLPLIHDGYSVRSVLSLTCLWLFFVPYLACFFGDLKC